MPWYIVVIWCHVSLSWLVITSQSLVVTACNHVAWCVIMCQLWVIVTCNYVSWCVVTWHWVNLLLSITVSHFHVSLSIFTSHFACHHVSWFAVIHQCKSLSHVVRCHHLLHHELVSSVMMCHCLSLCHHCGSPHIIACHQPLPWVAVMYHHMWSRVDLHNHEVLSWIVMCTHLCHHVLPSIFLSCHCVSPCVMTYCHPLSWVTITLSHVTCHHVSSSVMMCCHSCLWLDTACQQMPSFIVASWLCMSLDVVTYCHILVLYVIVCHHEFSSIAVSHLLCHYVIMCYCPSSQVIITGHLASLLVESLCSKSSSLVLYRVFKRDRERGPHLSLLGEKNNPIKIRRENICRTNGKKM